MEPLLGRPILRRSRGVPVALALGMLSLVGVAVIWGSAPSAAAVPSPSQYVSPSPPNSPFTDPLVILGIALGVLIAVLVILFILRFGGGRRPPPPAAQPTLSPEAFAATGGGESFAATSDAVKE